MRVLASVILIIIGALIVVVGVLYLTQPAHSLPSFIPGHLAHATGKHPKRGIAALVVGGLVFVGGIVLAVTGNRRYRW